MFVPGTLVKSLNISNQMNKNGAFTIVAKNYIGLAKILKESIEMVSPSVDFFIFVADEQNDTYNGEDGVLWAYQCLGINSDVWKDLSFKYDLTEFCTAIKPYCFKYFFDKENYSKVIYFDPDIYVFSDLSYFYSKLDTCSVILTPHVSTIAHDNEAEKTFLQSGIFNLGFLALSKTKNTETLLNWWSHKLLDSCFDDVLDYTFTDQKWMNFIPAFLPGDQYYIDRCLGADVAPWNYCERKIIFKGNVPSSVIDRAGIDTEIHPLRFIHYSGYDYRGMIMGQEHRTRLRSYIENYEDVERSNYYYTNILKERAEEFIKYLDLPYTYNTFTDGTKIDKFHRRLYRSLASREKVDNPFNHLGDFYGKLASIKALPKDRGQAIGTEGDYSSALAKFNKVMRLVYNLLGYRRYVALLRLLKYFSKFESQIFLIDSKYNGNSIDILNKK